MSSLWYYYDTNLTTDNFSIQVLSIFISVLLWYFIKWDLMILCEFSNVPKLLSFQTTNCVIANTVMQLLTFLLVLKNVFCKNCTNEKYFRNVDTVLCSCDFQLFSILLAKDFSISPILSQKSFWTFESSYKMSIK